MAASLPNGQGGSSISTNRGLALIGGRCGVPCGAEGNKYGATDKVVIVHPDKTEINYGTPLTSKKDGICVVKDIDRGRIIVAGGYPHHWAHQTKDDPEVLPTVEHINMDLSGPWNTLPDMNRPRFHQICTIAKLNGHPHMIVYGGIYGGSV